MPGPPALARTRTQFGYAVFYDAQSLERALAFPPETHVIRGQPLGVVRPGSTGSGASAGGGGAPGYAAAPASYYASGAPSSSYGGAGARYEPYPASAPAPRYAAAAAAAAAAGAPSDPHSAHPGGPPNGPVY